MLICLQALNFAWLELMGLTSHISLCKQELGIQQNNISSSARDQHAPFPFSMRYCFHEGGYAAFGWDYQAKYVSLGVVKVP